MNIKVGDFVTRNSYNNDIVFEVKELNNNVCVLRGIDFRLEADAEVQDLKKLEKKILENDEEYSKTISELKKSDRDEYFYLPGKILHIDSDSNYLKRCINFYKKAGVLAYGVHIDEKNLLDKLPKYLKEVSPDILIITGHDAYFKKRSDVDYKNSGYFIEAVKLARKYEKSSDKLIIIAGACQSNYEELIKAGATFASSPKRINIHALDPAIIATSVSLSERGEEINLKNLLNKTKYGKDGIGGLKSKGTMYIGYPR